ncbi:MAG: type II toxin-antitoxin system RelE/ParE family toxin [Acidaminococcaceae bacterium]|nr:type II toxin-antitoxin system RelE/ParE family toxin [Acidaminococcaceae bacterium]
MIKKVIVIIFEALQNVKTVKGRWSITVNGNWRLTFAFTEGHAYVLDYEDYH